MLAMFNEQRLATAAFLICTAFFSGCARDDGPERVVVVGEVSFNGEPLPSGMIRFKPTTSNSAPIAAAQIRDGQYKADVHGGVPVGVHRVLIEGYREQSTSDNADASAPPGAGSGCRQYLPAKYNTRSQLNLTITPSDSPFVKNFDLTD